MGNSIAIFKGIDIREQKPWITFEQFKGICSYPIWNYFRQSISVARAYDQGYAAGVHLLNLNEQFKDKLSPKEYTGNMKMLCRLCLEMLDMLDRWEEFLDAFEKIWIDKRFHFRCHKRSLDDEYGYLLKRGIISETEHYIYVHEFWDIADRIGVVERKIKRKEEGRKMGNMYHHTRENLTVEELNNRQEWLNNIIEELKNH